jgi:hypothetical protein
MIQLWQKLIRSRNAVILIESWLCRNVLVNLMGPLASWYCRYSILQAATKLNDLMLFCSTHKISGYRQKKKDEVSQLIAARVASDNINASIGCL